MASLKHEILHSPRVEEARKYHKQHNYLKKKAEQEGATTPKQKMPSPNSLEMYLDSGVRFGTWCKQERGCRHFTDCLPYIQDYADHLVAEGKSADTIHTYLAGICFVWDVPLSTIRKPKRHSANNTKSRGSKKSDKRKDRQPKCSPRLAAFAIVICLRKHDYVAMRQHNLVTDESGYLCVEVVKGKGGKYQLQRVPAGYEDFVRSYFNGNADEFVFTKDEVTNKIDLHHLRHVGALRDYRYYEQRLKDEPGYREQLITEIKARWAAYNDRPFSAHEMRGKYVMRGKNRELAESMGFQYSFDRLAVLATSIFHLAHWRNGVTVRNYIMAALVDEALSAAEENDT